MTNILKLHPLTKQAFANYGEVIETADLNSDAINEDTTKAFRNLANVDVEEGGGHAALSLYRAQARTLPLTLTMVERHPLGSQAFMPLTDEPFIVVVADTTGTQLEGFITDGTQGVNYAKSTWHHPLIALTAQDFVVIDRQGPGDNCEERALGTPWVVES